MKPSTSSRYGGLDLGDERAAEPGAVLEQVVHDQRAEDHAAGDGDERADAGRPGRSGTPVVIIGHGVLDRRPGVLEGRLVDAERVGLVGGLVDRRGRPRSPISSAWSTTPRTVARRRRPARASRPSTTRPAARLGFSLWRCEGADERLEHHGEDGRERHREHDLAHRRQRGDHDDRGQHEPDEAPRPHPQPRDPAEQARRHLPSPGRGRRRGRCGRVPSSSSARQWPAGVDAAPGPAR